MTRRRAPVPLPDAVRDRGFTPRLVDVPALVDLLDAVDDELADDVERALARSGTEGAKLAMERFPSLKTVGRARLLRTLGRLGGAAEEPREMLRVFVAGRLAESEPRVRRAAANALGRLGGEEAERALLAVWEAGAAPDLARAIAGALGKIGGEAAMTALRALRTDDAELRRISEEALLKLARTLGRTRGEASFVDPSVAAPRAIAAVLHCRGGLEEILRAEIDPTLRPRPERPAAIAVDLTGPLSRLQRPRTALRFGFPLADAPPGTDPVEAVIAALGSDLALEILSTWTRGPLRYRLEWASGGHRRAATYACAREIGRRRPSLLNDPTDSPWEAIVIEHDRRTFVELWPRGLADPRFAWRRRDVPASSHPTLAAALARVAGVRPEDVVWDPFCGAGAELIERAILGPQHAAFGSDRDPRAIEAARANCAAADVRVSLHVADAATFVPPRPPTLLITNPPMGRRVLDAQTLAPVLESSLRAWARALAPGGRVVWLSPLPERTVAIAESAGLRTALRRRVDMGGFSAELQRFDKP